MTIRQEILRALSCSKLLLKDSLPLVLRFLKSNINPDGGFKGRNEQSDLYYTVFGLEALLALDSSFSRDYSFAFLEKFIDSKPQDLIHMASLVRCYANLSDDGIERSVRSEFIKDIENFRSADGGYADIAGCDKATIYSCFFALAAYHDLQAEMPDPAAVVECIQSLATADGGFSNNSNIQIGSTNATAAAIIVLRHLDQQVSEKTAEWLFLQCTSNGGFVAVPKAPIPDLLSTATALHALATAGFDISPVKERCLDYIDNLWTNQGGFYGSQADTILDCEYTYYGLLALGHLGR